MNQSQASARRTLRNARRESLLVAGIVLVALIWTVGYCGLRGYQHPADSWLITSGLAVNRTSEDLTTVLGIPDWIFIGVVLPWTVCTIITIALSLRGLADDDLGTEQETADPHAS
jgi:hypothetical protein